MGWLSNIISSGASLISSGLNTIKNVAKTVYNTTKETVTKAVSWMADKAEVFIGSVKDVWNKVKPIINNVVRPLIQSAIQVTSFRYPWITAGLTALDKALEYLVKWDQTDLAKRIAHAIEWTIQRAKELKNAYLTEEELEKAQEHEAALREAKYKVQGEAKKAVDVATLINHHFQLSTRIKDLLDNVQIDDFEHYLRLRASQKLLKNMESKLENTQNIDEINEDDIFIMETANELLKREPNLSDEAMMRLDNIIMIRFSKKLIPFVFEEMIMAWSFNLKDLEKEWKKLNTEFSEQQVIQRRLNVALKLDDLTEEQNLELQDLNRRLPQLEATMTLKRKRTNEMRHYVYAAEGFLQMLEKDPEEFVDQEYLMEDSNEVGKIIIDCAQFGKKWEELTVDEQTLVIDFSNIFKNDSELREKQLIEVAA